MARRKFNPLSEVGTAGLTRFMGTVSEEFLLELQGTRGIKRFKEMSKSPIGGALLRAIGVFYRRVEWHTEVGGDTSQDTEAQAFLESCRNDLNIPWAGLVAQMMQMLVHGHRWFEIVYKKRRGLHGDPSSKYNDGRLGWRKFADRPPETLGMGRGEWSFDDAGGVRGVWQCAPPDFKKVWISIEKSLLFRTTDDKGNPEGESIFRPGWRSYYFVRELETVEAIVEERMGGVLMINLPDDPAGFNLDPDDSDSLYNQAKDTVTNFRADEQMGLVVPAGCTAELLSPGSGQRNIGDTIQRHKWDFLMTCLHEFMLVGSEPVGTYALHRDKVDWAMMGLEGWLDNVEAVLNGIAVPRLFSLNVFPGITAYPRLVHGRIGIRHVEVFFEALNNAVQSQVITIHPEDEAEARRILGMPKLPEEGVTQVETSSDDLLTEAFRAPSRPRRGRRSKWERMTGSYQDQLQSGYEDWAEELEAALMEAESEQDRVLEEALLVLLAFMRDQGRTALTEAYMEGMGDTPPSPESIEVLAAAIRENEGYITTSLIPAIRARAHDALSEQPSVLLTANAFTEEMLSRRHRVGLYAGAFWAALWGGWLAPFGYEERFRWVAVGDERTCSSCAALNGQVFTRRDLPTLPGQDVECDGNCRCVLEEV